ncbi:MAG: response regulator [Blautia sp.]|nr:response regulator [Blautia sp.]
MLRVLIADDEKNICMMIRKLIFWENYGMEVIDMVHNGVDALRVIEEQHPDLVITDIRMPGYDGLEIVRRTREQGITVIIISGYQQFEYAHTALNLGVEHYILKPIDKSELEATLKKVAEKHDTLVKQAEEKDALKERVFNDRKRIRQHFISDIMDREQAFRIGNDRKEENDNSGFDRAQFVAVLLKLDTDDRAFNLDGMLQKMEHMLEHDFREGKGEYINSRINSGIMTIINYHYEEEQNVKNSIENTFHRLLQETGKFQGLHATVGIGGFKGDISQVSESIYEAVSAIKCRGDLGLDRVIWNKQLNYTSVDVEAILRDSVRELKQTTVSLDYRAFRGRITSDLMRIKRVINFSPVAFYDYFDRIIEMLRNNMDFDIHQNHSGENGDAFFQKLHQCMDSCVDVNDMAHGFIELVQHEFEAQFTEKNNREQRPVRMARQYLQEHFREQVTLEIVAEAIGLSNTYLSTMFKKEMGISFSDCLLSFRMEGAKELLKTTDKPIMEIAEEVGYTDAKYFSKSFQKAVGLKPSAYRRMYGR